MGWLLEDGRWASPLHGIIVYSSQPFSPTLTSSAHIPSLTGFQAELPAAWLACSPIHLILRKEIGSERWQIQTALQAVWIACLTSEE